MGPTSRLGLSGLGDLVILRFAFPARVYTPPDKVGYGRRMFFDGVFERTIAVRARSKCAALASACVGCNALR